MNHTTLNDSRPMRILFAIGMMLFTIAHHCHAQILISDVFSGTNTGSTSLVDTAAIGLGSTANATVGPGYDGTLFVGVSVGFAETMTINAATTSGDFTLGATGLAGVASTFDATKTFTGLSLADSTTYKFTLTDAVGTNLALLSALNFSITQGGTTVVNTATGVGLTGGVAENLATAFSGNTATITFTTPSTLNTTQPLVFDFNGGALASLIGTSVEFTDGSIQAVPEPSTWAMLVMGVAAMGAGLYFKRSAGVKLARVRA